MSTDGQDWSEEDLQLLLKYLGRHLIALVLAYRFRKDDGELDDQTHFACLTAFVVIVGEHWYLVTAGHNIDDWRPATRNDSPIQIVAASLADYFWISATRKLPLPYNLFDQVYYHAYSQSEDIDYAVILIDQELRSALASNGVLPLPINEARKSYDDFYGFGIVGFPEELCGPDQPNDPNSLIAGVRPVLVPISLDPIPTPPDRHPTFIANVVTMGNQISVMGMSGGPIFGYRMGNDGNSQYEVVAIQSQWNQADRRIIACPVTVALAEVRNAILAKHKYDD